jgi:hypothetical protein
MANTTWNPSDKAAGITLSGSNLIATNVGGGIFAVRTVGRQVAGKFYWEYTCTTWVGTGGIGVVGQSFPISGTHLNNNAQHSTTSLDRTGNCYVNGTVQGGISFGTLAGVVVCVALDLNARLIWYRVGAAGNWNAGASNNPATGVGGVAIPDMGYGIPVYPCVEVQQNNDSITANFGDSAFTGAVPVGFTSGFTAGASIPTNALASQINAEHWLTTSPQAQVTQIAAEHWASATNTGLQAVVTQIAAEHWASVASVPLQVGGPIVTMIG